MSKKSSIQLIFKRKNASPVTRVGAICDALSTELGNIVTSRSFKVACKIADYAADFSTTVPYKDVTGNLSESMGIAVVGSNQKRGTLSVGRYYAPSKRMAGARGNSIRHTELPLGKGEPFHGLVYPDGTRVTRKNLYHGETDRYDNDKSTGVDERADYLRDLRATPAFNKRTLYTVHAFVAMKYASYVNRKHGDRLLGYLSGAMKDALSEVRK